MKKISLNIRNLINIFVLISCCDIAYFEYLNDYVAVILLGMRLIFIMLFVLELFFKKDNWSKVFGLINILFLIFICNSISRTDTIIMYLLKILSKPYLIALYMQKNLNKDDNIKKLLSTWKKLLFVICFVDFITIIIFPNGMYKDGNYSINWFLGYKTARLVYSWTLLFIISYLDFGKLKEGKKHFSKFNVFVYFMCIFSAYKSEATGASTALIIYVVLIYLLRIENDRNSGGRLYLVYNPKNVILYSGIVYYLVMTIESNVYVQNFVISVFNKSTTLSNRTGIWENCIDFFLKSPIIGKGIYTPLEYTDITKYYLGTNAHNFLLTMLISGGIIALIIYLSIIKISMTRKTLKYTRQELTLISAVIVFVFLGITSSALVYSPFAYLPFMLLEHEKNKKREENDYEGINNEK